MDKIVGKTHEGYTLEFGLDQTLGWWYSVKMVDDETPIEEKSTEFNGLTQNQLADYLENNLSSVDLTNLYSCITSIRMGMSPQMGIV